MPRVGEIITQNGVKYLVLPNGFAAEIARFNPDGTPVLRATVVSKDEGFDEFGNKKVSTSVNVECFKLELGLKQP